MSAKGGAGRKLPSARWLLIAACLIAAVTMIGSMQRRPITDVRLPEAVAAAEEVDDELAEPPYSDIPRPLRPHRFPASLSPDEREFWRQPDGGGLRPCVRPSAAYVAESPKVVAEVERYLIVVVSGGLNQLRNQICDAVVIARILNAVLVVPILQVNVIWNDFSEFMDIFDAGHFKKVLAGDVKVVASLPAGHAHKKPSEEKHIPFHSEPQWFLENFHRRLQEEKVLLLRGLDARLVEDLPRDLQKLRCKVEFHALRYARPIQVAGRRLGERLWTPGPYLALHLRLEKDVWVRTGCLPGLGPELDEEILRARSLAGPKLLTSRKNLTYAERRAEGMCPLTGEDIARLLLALGATNRTRVFWAGGAPYGGERALAALRAAFPLLFNKESLATRGELAPLRPHANMLAAVDFLLCLNADVFLPSHGGNMAHVLQGHRAYAGHRKHITPNKREIAALLAKESVTEEEFRRRVRRAHGEEAMGAPQLRMAKKGRDVVAFPVPECMCRKRARGRGRGQGG